MCFDTSFNLSKDTCQGIKPRQVFFDKPNHIRIRYDEYDPIITDKTDFPQYRGKNALNAFTKKMQIGDIVLSCYTAATIDTIGVITGEYEWHDKYTNYKRLRKVYWIVKHICVHALTILINTEAKTSTNLLTLADIAATLFESANPEDIRVIPSFTKRRVRENEAYRRLPRIAIQ